MAFDLARAAQRVERSGGHQAVYTETFGAFRLVDDAQRFHVDDAGKNGHAAAHDGDGFLQHVIALRIGEEGHRPAAGTEEKQAVDARLDHAVDGALE